MNTLPVGFITKMLNSVKGDDYLQLLFALAQFASRDENYRLASLYLEEILKHSPNLADPTKMLQQVSIKLGDLAIR
jgi:hypothetical protein